MKTYRVKVNHLTLEKIKEHSLGGLITEWTEESPYIKLEESTFLAVAQIAGEQGCSLEQAIRMKL